MEILKHFLGICGDHWHPNVYTIIFIIVLLKAFQYYYKKING